MPPYFARWVELWCGVTTIAWALVAGVVMQVELSQVAQLVAVARFGSNTSWCVIGIVLGAAQAVSALRGWRFARWWSTTLVFFFYVVLADGVFLAPTTSPGVVFYIGWALANMISVLRIIRPTR